MLGLKPRRRRGPDQVGLAPLPLAPYSVAAGVPQWAPDPVTPPWWQIGRYGTTIPTQQAGYWPGLQLRCGVESIDRDYLVLSATGADLPYFQQTAYPVDPRRNLLDGKRPGNALGVAGVANLLGPARKARALAEQGLQTEILGW